MSEPGDLEARIQGLEERLLRAEVRQSRVELDELLAGDFREFGSSGRVFDRAAIMAHLQAESPWELGLHDFRAQILSADLVLATYRATARRRASEEVSHSLRSSLWRRDGDRWQVIFHQGTRGAGAEV